MLIGILLLGLSAIILAVIGMFAVPLGLGAAISPLYLAAALALFLAIGLWMQRNLVRLRRALTRSHHKQRRMSATARIDPLTGMFNRASFMRALDKALARRQNGGPSVAVLLVDLNFMPVNDAHGHAVGDQVLIEMARRISAAKQAGTTVARVGGDEFALLLEGDAATPETIGHRLLDDIAAPVQVPNGNVRISATIGIAAAEKRQVSGEELLRAAELALRGTRRGLHGSLRRFEAGMEEALKERHALEVDLRRALDEDEIVPFYQPLIALDGDRLIGFEVLARWQHPTRGLIPPAAFIPLAEEIGRIGELFDKLLVRACSDARSWPSDLRLSVNISPTQFAEPQMASRILDILAKENFAPARLELEITENALVDEVSSARLILTTLRNVGVSVALDDFGTGYSSLRHLSDLPVDRLKIDRGFVESARLNEEGWRIVRAIVQLAGTFDLATTAEGIEAPEILSTLRELGCDIGQGYLFGKPISAEQTSLWLLGRPLPTALAS
ncbi:putative bifunctional diguanylate cyclase/phosphodiesterase [Kaistia nematophila]|uniref:EAL domain-containing protein n=1 Tax=Kaistia nematophila TaxID=2994654 RepID=A0A9X3DZY4_9HYPH|nr:EAL domain-containing protein [Kaistia nematophila]MCX5568418.1 EAL domain-containing protein [Kaistia nematophila]